jgi:hypothetical protein
LSLQTGYTGDPLGIKTEEDGTATTFIIHLLKSILESKYGSGITRASIILITRSGPEEEHFTANATE